MLVQSVQFPEQPFTPVTVGGPLHLFFGADGQHGTRAWFVRLHHPGKTKTSGHQITAASAKQQSNGAF